MTRTFFISLLLSFVTVSTALAESLKLTGRVRYAKDSTAVEGANVTLYDNHTKVIAATISNAEGAFQLEGEGAETAARVEISFIGFLPVSIQASSWSGAVHLGDIYMVEDSKELDAVMVSGELRKINRQLVFPDRQQIKSSQDVMTLLDRLALNGLAVDQVNKNATIYGKPIQWKVDGVPSTAEKVKSLKPSSILRIDYTNMPSLRELDRGFGGVIDVILKEKNDGGSVFAHVQSALWVGFVNASGSVSYHQGKSDVELNYSGNYRNYPKWERSIEQQFIGDKKTITHQEAPENSPFEMLDQYLNLSYSYKPTSQRLFSAAWRNYLGSRSLDIRSNITQTDREAFHRSSMSQFKGYAPTLDLFYQYAFQNGGRLETNLVGYFWKSKDQRDLEDRANGSIISTYSNPTNSQYYSIIGETSYEQSLHEKVYMAVGLQHKYAHTFNEYLSAGRYLDRMDENNTYVYAQFSGQLSSSVQYQIGSGAKFFYVKKGASTKLYIKNQSALSLVYTPVNGLTLSLNSYFTPFLPTLGQLSNVKERYDELTMHTGNSELKPSYRLTNRLNLNYRQGKFNTNLALSYIYTFDPMFTFATYEPIENYFLFKPVNGKFNQQYGAEWKINYRKLFDFLSLYGTVGYNRYESNVDDKLLHLNSLYWNISAQLFYKDFTLSMYYSATGDRLYSETISGTGNSAGITLAWSKYGWTVYAQMLYVGHKDGDKYITTSRSAVTPSKSVVRIPENGNMLTLGVAWSLDFGKPKKSSNRRLYNSDSNQSVVKVQE